MEEIWKDIDDKLEVSSLGRVRSKIIVIKGENLGDGLEIIPPKYFDPPSYRAYTKTFIRDKIVLRLQKPYIEVYADLFQLRKDKNHVWRLVNSNLRVCVDNIEGRMRGPKGPKPKGDAPISYAELQRKVAAFKKDYATGMVSLTNF